MKKRSIIRKNLVYSIGFGILIGILFPFFTTLFIENFKNNLARIIYFICCVSAGIIVGYSSFIITNITILKIVRMITKELGKISKGRGDLTKRIDIKSDDEIGELVVYFNEFIEKLNNMITGTKKIIVSSKENSENLYNGMRNTVKLISEIYKSVNEVKDMNQTQISQVEISKHSLKDLNKVVLILITYVMDFFTQMDDLTKILVNQTKSVDVLLKNINNISNKIGGDSEFIENNEDMTLSQKSIAYVTETINAMEKYKDSIQKIENFLQVIIDITTKTNLLAINASIEASNAGDSGKGFQIVAKEIRNLADNSKKMTSDIQNVLNIIKSDMTHSVERILVNKHEFSSVLDQVKDTSKNLITGIMSIEGITSKVKNTYNSIEDMLNSLKSKLENLRDTSKYCEKAMEDLDNIAINITKNIEILTEDSSIIEDATIQILEKTDQSKKIIENVESHISQYKTEDNKEEEIEEIR